MSNPRYSKWKGKRRDRDRYGALDKFERKRNVQKKTQLKKNTQSG